MRIFSSICLMAALAFPVMFSSCTALRTATPVPAAYQSDEDEGWATKHIPGMKSLVSLLPPPTDARKQWDLYQRRKGEHSQGEDSSPQFP
jgi:hypothetical protein